MNPFEKLLKQAEFQTAVTDTRLDYLKKNEITLILSVIAKTTN